jgi:signal transduction histidine kinase
MQSVVREQKQEQGSGRFYQVITTPVADPSGGVFQVLESWMDITESVEQETAIRQQAAENEKLAALVQLSAGVIHEVANPLAAIRTTIDVMEKELPAGSSQRFEAVRNKIDDLGRFLRTFSLYARPGKPHLHPSNIQTILRSVVQLLEDEARRRQVEVVERYDENMGLVQASPLQLQQVFINLLINAFDAMPEGGRVTIFAEGQTDGILAVSVADTGIGIPPAQLGRIFEPFFSTKPSGTGLGLAIVQQIVKAHGAELKVSSNPGSGTAFTIRFPAAASQGAA